MKRISPNGARQFLEIRARAHAGQLCPSRRKPILDIQGVRENPIVIR
jgi:hypothetical protein